MNTLRTVFAFVVLVCAIAFASAAYVISKETNNWRKMHADLKAQTDKTIADLNTNIAKLTEEKKTAEAEREKWKSAVDDRIKTIGERDAEIQKLNGTITDLTTTTKRQSDDIAEIKNQLKIQTDRNIELKKEADDARDARIAAEKAQRDAEDKQRALEDDVKNLREQLKLTKSQMKSAEELNARYSAVYGENGLRLAQAAPAPVPTINGRVLNADNPMRLVAISVGKDDGVIPGMLFEVVRPTANQYVGRVRVLEVKDEEAICRIDVAMTPGAIVEGDHVTTRVR